MDYLLQLFKGLANETRLKIVELLLDGREYSIEDIANKLKIPFATCCRNLKIMERVYLIESRRKLGYVFYRLNKPDKHMYNKLIVELVKLRKGRLSKGKSKQRNSTFAKK